MKRLLTGSAWRIYSKDFITLAGLFMKELIVQYILSTDVWPVGLQWAGLRENSQVVSLLLGGNAFRWEAGYTSHQVIHIFGHTLGDLNPEPFDSAKHWLFVSQWWKYFATY